MTITKKIALAFAAVVAAQILIAGLAFASAAGSVMWTTRLLYVVLTIVVGWLSVRGIGQSLKPVIQEIAQGAEQVSSAALQISTASQSLAEGTSQQAASLEETSASTEEINSMARRNSENSRSAADLVKQSDQKFTDTNQSLQGMISAMAEINTSSDKISKIIKVIDEIAFQTNILALNAAVEAARAGEAGMGFAVVADEVRNLAQRCAQAARDTAVLIEESISKSNDGKLKVDQVAKAIQRITEQSAQVKILVDEVHLGSQEQSRGIEQIGKAIVQMEQITQKAAASAEESASTAEQLKGQSSTLKHVVQRLDSIIGSTGPAVKQKREAVRPLVKSQRSPSNVRVAVQSTMKTTLSALQKAVSKDTPKKQEPVAVSAAAPEKNSFPMDENFQEF